jgi:hypothetical protein
MARAWQSLVRCEIRSRFNSTIPQLECCIREISDEIASLLTPVRPCVLVTAQGEMIDAETMLSIRRGNKAVVAAEWGDSG